MPRAPALASVAVPARTLNGVLEFLGHAANLAYSLAGWAVGLVDNPVVHAIRYYFFSGTIYYLLGIPDDLFISIFAMGRIPGWTAQVVEQFENNILLRPRLLYTGEMDVPYVPIGERG